MDKTGKILRIAAIILFGLTTAMNLLGGIGTSCVAFSNNVGYRMAFKEIMDVRWLYQALVVTTTLLGLAGIWGIVKLVRGGPKVFRTALIILAVGCVLGGIHYFTSLSLRGKAAPANVKFYLNLLTLIYFAILALPGLRKKVDFNAPGGKNETRAGAGAAAIISGLLCMTVFHWAAPSHTVLQENWTYVFYVPLMTVGTVLILGGFGLVGKSVSDIIVKDGSSKALVTSKSNVLPG